METVEEVAKSLLLVLGVAVVGTLGTIAAIRISEIFWQLVFREDGPSAGSPSRKPRRPSRRRDGGRAWRTPHAKPALQARRRESSRS